MSVTIDFTIARRNQTPRPRRQPRPPPPPPPQPPYFLRGVAI